MGIHPDLQRRDPRPAVARRRGPRRGASFVLVFVLAGLLLGGGGPEAARAQSAPAPQAPVPSPYPEFPDSPPDAPTARLRLVFDLVSGAQELAAAANEPFDVYLVAHDVQVALHAYEVKLLLDPRLTVLDRQVEAKINIGKDDEIIAALDPQDCRTGSPIVLGHFRMMLTEPGQSDVVLGLGPVGRPSAPTVPTEFEGPTPVYLVCRPGSDLRPFQACEVCAVVNPVSVRPEVDETQKKPLDDLLRPLRGRR